MKLNVVLYHPEIPQNTGNIMRSCVGFNAKLHLIKPLGFELDEKKCVQLKEKMKETNAVLGGEMSGHTFFKDRYFGYDDAVYAGCRAIEIISENKKTNPAFRIQSLLAPFDAVYTSDEVRYPCPNNLKKVVLEEFKGIVASTPDLFQDAIKEIVTLDGMRVVFDGGFALIRQSNTEPVFTLRFEGKTSELCKQYQDAMIASLDGCLERQKAMLS